MAEAHTEIEQKFDVDTSFALPALADVVPSVTDVQTVVIEFEAIYFDTADLRLAARKITLRRRAGGEDEGWHLKLPLGKGVRVEYHEPFTDDLVVPDPLLTLVTATTRGAELVPIARLRNTRTAYRLRDDSGRVLVELADDSVIAQRLHEDAVPTSWREIEIEVIDGELEHLSPLADVLTEAGALPSGSGSKLAKAIGTSVKPPRPDLLDPDLTAGALVLAYLRRQRNALLANDPAVRLDRPDSVHKMRVASRRFRSALKAFDSLFEGDAHLRLEKQVGDFARTLGAERDAEVLLERMDKAIDGLPPELIMGPVRHDVDSWMGNTLAQAKRETRAYLDSADYVSLLDDIEAFLAAPPLSELAAGPARKVAAHAVNRTVHKVQKKGADGLAIKDEASRMVKLHEARRAAKRSRYAAEVYEMHDTKAARKVDREMEALQETLGDVHDGAVMAELLREFAARTGAKRGNGFTYGILLAREQGRGANAERDFAEALGRLRPLSKPSKHPKSGTVDPDDDPTGEWVEAGTEG